jgi:histidyl-tRNA synthetase
LRADNTQRGRYREFLQVDIDTVGSSSPLSDAEIVELVIKGYEKLGFKNAKILVNDRSVFEGLDGKAIRIIDKLEKAGEEEVKKDLKIAGFVENLISELKNKKPSASISKIIEMFPSVVFDPTMARGLDYYTGLIIEVKVEGYDAGSLGGGGRYDNLIGMFANQPIPAVGFAFGFDRIIEAMEELNLFPADLRSVDILVTKSGEQSAKIANELRGQGLKIELYVDEKETDKQLRYADRKQIPYVLLFNEGKMVLKNMKDGSQKEVTLDQVKEQIS